VLILGAAVGLIGIVAAATRGGTILRALYGSPYADQKRVLIVLMVGGAVGHLASLGGYAANATRAFDTLAGPYLVQAVVALACAAVLIPSHGLLGAAWATVIANLCGCLVPVFVFKSLRRQRA
jgi:O-antigen/teichoic acid export membrane protein